MISFIIPIYKKEPRQLENCVKSLLDQSYRDLEIICVFDGANTELQKIAYDLRHTENVIPRNKWLKKIGFKDRVQIINNPIKLMVLKHGGAPRARNAGFKESKGEYVCFWDADCYAQPEMVQIWMDTFKENSDCDFVYGGYAFTNTEKTAFKSNPFDPWLIEKYNYIASMFPIKREKVVEWDESLRGLQDWDFWRRVIKNGSKGAYISPPWYGWVTDEPLKTDISGSEGMKREDKISVVRAKHKDRLSDYLLCGSKFRQKAIELAKDLEADYFNLPWWVTKKYKMVYSLGFDADENLSSTWVQKINTNGTIRIVHWMRDDVIRICKIPYIYAQNVIKSINKEKFINLADDESTCRLLDEMGLKSFFVPVPTDLTEIETTLPDKFKVLVKVDESSVKMFDSIKKAMPDIDIDFLEINSPVGIEKYSLYIDWNLDKQITEGMKRMLVNGRYVISNIQAPFAGFISEPDNLVKFKRTMINLIRDFRKHKDINRKAQDYYKKLFSMGGFRKTLSEIVAKGEKWEGPSDYWET